VGLVGSLLRWLMAVPFALSRCRPGEWRLTWYGGPAEWRGRWWLPLRWRLLWARPGSGWVGRWGRGLGWLPV